MPDARLIFGVLVVAMLPWMACGQGEDRPSTQARKPEANGLFLFDLSGQLSEPVPLLGSPTTTTPAISPRPAAAPTFTHESPVQLFGLINRQNPATSISDDELALLSERYAAVSGLDGHGYNFPGAIASLRAIDAEMPVLCHTEAMAIQMDGGRYSQLDANENGFFHSADPASLRVLIHDGSTILWFKRDARAYSANGRYTAHGVLRYLVEAANAEEGPFELLSDSLIEDGSSYYYHQEAATDVSRFYRVRTQLGDLSEVVYSNPVQPDAATTSLGIVSMNRNGDFSVTCYGADCPADAKDVVLQVDLNNNRVFDDGDCTLADGQTTSPDTCEREPATDRIVLGDGGVAYTGRLQRPTQKTLFSYRAILANVPTVVAPAEGRSYQVSGINNRLQMPSFGSLLVDPNDAVWRDQLEKRLLDCLDHGYNGMRLDFAFDSIDLPWIATGRAIDSELSRVAAIPTAVNSILDRLSVAAPTAILTFNGYYVATGQKPFFDSYLDSTDGADFEFFAFGFRRNATEIHSGTAEAAARILDVNRQGKWAIAVSRYEETNIAARLKSLTMYLLIAGDNVYYCCQTDRAGQNIPYFPEWDVPLGRPLAVLDELGALVDPRADRLFSRDFENGSVHYNAGNQPIEIDLGETHHRLSVTGGLDPIVGGDGVAHYDPVTVLAIEPKDVAIVVHLLP